MKKIFLSLLAITLLTTLIHAQDTNQNIIHTPKNTVFLWDMHDVFMKPESGRIIKSIWNYDHKMSIIRNIDLHTTKTIFRYIGEKIGIGQPLTNPEHIFKSAQEAGNEALVEFIIDTSCKYTPMKNTIAIITMLKNLGYQHDLGSNVSYSTFQTFKNMYLDIFSSFTNFHIITINTPRKPNIEYFIEYNKNYNKQQKHVIFIDNKLKNIKAAQKTGMIGIHFVSAQQLYKDLKKLGIKLPDIFETEEQTHEEIA